MRPASNQRIVQADRLPADDGGENGFRLTVAARTHLCPIRPARSGNLTGQARRLRRSGPCDEDRCPALAVAFWLIEIALVSWPFGSGPVMHKLQHAGG